MISSKEYECVSMFEFLDSYGKQAVDDIVKDFTCLKNIEIQKFLIENSYDFSVKYQAITYFILSNETNEIEAYFTLSIKPIIIDSTIISKNTLKKLLRISEIDEENNTVNPSAYLIAQLGKKDGSLIDIDKIFRFINITIERIQKSCGGVVEFLESENNDKLVKMYQDIGFKTFNIRKSKSGEDRKLIQMYRLI